MKHNTLRSLHAKLESNKVRLSEEEKKEETNKRCRRKNNDNDMFVSPLLAHLKNEDYIFFYVFDEIFILFSKYTEVKMSM